MHNEQDFFAFLSSERFMVHTLPLRDQLNLPFPTPYILFCTYSMGKSNNVFHGSSFVKNCTYMCVYIYTIDEIQNLKVFHICYDSKHMQTLIWLLLVLTLLCENKLLTVVVASSWLSDLTAQEMFKNLCS